MITIDVDRTIQRGQFYDILRDNHKLFSCKTLGDAVYAREEIERLESRIKDLEKTVDELRFPEMRNEKS